MNDTIRSILGRRSIRQFKSEQIKDLELLAIVEAGKYAPSAKNEQPWQFIVIQRQDLRTRINESCKEVLLNSGNNKYIEKARKDHFEIFHNAPTIILVFANGEGIAPQNDGTLALQNMFIAAESLNIGSCWIHSASLLFSMPEGDALKAELGVLEGYVPIGAGAFGYKTSLAVPAPRKEGTVLVFK